LVWYILDSDFFSYIFFAQAIVSDMNQGRFSVISCIHWTLGYDVVYVRPC